MPEPTLELPKLRRADCGHGYLRMDTPASGVDSMRGEHVYLCAVCRGALNQTIETKGK